MQIIFNKKKAGNFTHHAMKNCLPFQNSRHKVLLPALATETVTTSCHGNERFVTAFVPSIIATIVIETGKAHRTFSIIPREVNG
jgi:hypothetical protein